VVVASKDLPLYAQRVIVGGEEPLVNVVAGYFRSTYVSSIDLFATLTTPIVEDIEDAHPMTHSFD
jgi:hypothetical protein